MTRRNRLRAFAAGAALATTALAPAAAHAYGQGDCDAAFGSGNTAIRYDVNVDTGDVGKVDFGDDFHVGGKPQGNAVVCFADNGGVKVMGKLFADSWWEEVRVGVKIDINYRTSSGGTQQAGSTTKRNTFGWRAKSIYVERVGSYPGRQYVSARIRLYRGGWGATFDNGGFTKYSDHTYTRGAQ
jgi:hypothetical protein